MLNLALVGAQVQDTSEILYNDSQPMTEAIYSGLGYLFCRGWENNVHFLTSPGSVQTDPVPLRPCPSLANTSNIVPVRYRNRPHIFTWFGLLSQLSPPLPRANAPAQQQSRRTQI